MTTDVCQKGEFLRCSTLFIAAVFIGVGWTESASHAADNSPEARLAEAMSFGEKLLDRELTFISDFVEYSGRQAFDARASNQQTARNFREKTSGAVRRDRKVCWTKEFGSFPASADSQLVKVLATRERRGNINYVTGDDTKVDGFTEGPLTNPFDGHASVAGQGLWFGYIALRKFPVFSSLSSQVKWVASDDGARIVGQFDDWELAFIVEKESPSRLRRIDLKYLKEPPQDREDVLGRSVEVQEWETFDGIVCPKKVVMWDLVWRKDGEWSTWRSLVTLEQVGPIINISDRYGDFFTDVPNGSPVQVNDLKHVDFIWQDGEIVTKVDHEKLASLLGKRFASSPARTYLLIINGIVVFGLIAFFVFKKLRKTPAHRTR